MIFEENGILYDVALKVAKVQAPSYRQIFSNILFNLRVDNMLIFDENDKLEKIQVIDLSKL